jgi:hypothetical protein
MSRARRNRAHATRRVRPLEQETPRRARDFGLDMRRLKRLRVITFSILALPLLALALLAGKFVSMPITQAWHGSAYSQQQFTEAAERLSPVWVINWFEPYLPHLTKGTDLLQDGKNAEAEKELQAALDTWADGHDLNQPMHAQCKIRNNLAISIERQAAEIKDDGDRADRMFEAEQIITPCMSGGGGGDDDQGQGGGDGDDGDDQGQGGDGDDQGQGGGDGDDEGTSSGDPGEDEGTGDEDEGTGNEDQGTTDDNGKRIEDERRDADKKAGNDPDEREKDQKGKDQDKGDQGGQDDGNGGPKDPGDPKREDPEGSEKPEEAPTEGDSTEEQKKKDELDKRNKDANDGEGEDDSDGGDDNPAKPW